MEELKFVIPVIIVMLQLLFDLLFAYKRNRYLKKRILHLENQNALQAKTLAYHARFLEQKRKETLSFTLENSKN